MIRFATKQLSIIRLIHFPFINVKNPINDDQNLSLDEGSNLSSLEEPKKPPKIIEKSVPKQEAKKPSPLLNKKISKYTAKQTVNTTESKKELKKTSKILDESTKVRFKETLERLANTIKSNNLNNSTHLQVKRTRKLKSEESHIMEKSKIKLIKETKKTKGYQAEAIKKMAETAKFQKNKQFQQERRRERSFLEEKTIPNRHYKIEAMAPLIQTKTKFNLPIEEQYKLIEKIPAIIPFKARAGMALIEDPLLKDNINWRESIPDMNINDLHIIQQRFLFPNEYLNCLIPFTQDKQIPFFELQKLFNLIRPREEEMFYFNYFKGNKPEAALLLAYPTKEKETKNKKIRTEIKGLLTSLMESSETEKRTVFPSDVWPVLKTVFAKNEFDALNEKEIRHMLFIDRENEYTELFRRKDLFEKLPRIITNGEITHIANLVENNLNRSILLDFIPFHQSFMLNYSCSLMKEPLDKIFRIAPKVSNIDHLSLYYHIFKIYPINQVSNKMQFFEIIIPLLMQVIWGTMSNQSVKELFLTNMRNLYYDKFRLDFNHALKNLVLDLFITSPNYKIGMTRFMFFTLILSRLDNLSPEKLYLKDLFMQFNNTLDKSDFEYYIKNGIPEILNLNKNSLIRNAFIKEINDYEKNKNEEFSIKKFTFFDYQYFNQNKKALLYHKSLKNMLKIEIYPFSPNILKSDQNQLIKKTSPSNSIENMIPSPNKKLKKFENILLSKSSGQFKKASLQNMHKFLNQYGINKVEDPAEKIIQRCIEYRDYQRLATNKRDFGDLIETNCSNKEKLKFDYEFIKNRVANRDYINDTDGWVERQRFKRMVNYVKMERLNMEQQEYELKKTDAIDYNKKNQKKKNIENKNEVILEEDKKEEKSEPLTRIPKISIFKNNYIYKQAGSATFLTIKPEFYKNQIISLTNLLQHNFGKFKFEDYDVEKDFTEQGGGQGFRKFLDKMAEIDKENNKKKVFTKPFDGLNQEDIKSAARNILEMELVGLEDDPIEDTHVNSPKKSIWVSPSKIQKEIKKEIEPKEPKEKKIWKKVDKTLWTDLLSEKNNIEDIKLIVENKLLRDNIDFNRSIEELVNLEKIGDSKITGLDILNLVFFDKKGDLLKEKDSFKIETNCFFGNLVRDYNIYHRKSNYNRELPEIVYQKMFEYFVDETKYSRKRFKYLIVHLLYFTKNISESTISSILQVISKQKLGLTLFEICVLLVQNHIKIDKKSATLIFSEIYKYKGVSDDTEIILKMFLREYGWEFDITLVNDYLNKLIEYKRDDKYLLFFEHMKDFLMLKRESKSDEIKISAIEARNKRLEVLKEFYRQFLNKLNRGNALSFSKLVYLDMKKGEWKLEVQDYLYGMFAFSDQPEDFMNLYKEFREKFTDIYEEKIFICVAKAAQGSGKNVLYDFFDGLINEYIYGEKLELKINLIHIIMNTMHRNKKYIEFCTLLRYLKRNEITVNELTKNICYHIFNTCKDELAKPYMKGLIETLFEKQKDENKNKEETEYKKKFNKIEKIEQVKPIENIPKIVEKVEEVILKKENLEAEKKVDKKIEKAETKEKKTEKNDKKKKKKETEPEIEVVAEEKKSEELKIEPKEEKKTIKPKNIKRPKLENLIELSEKDSKRTKKVKRTGIQKFDFMKGSL